MSMAQTFITIIALVIAGTLPLYIVFYKLWNLYLGLKAETAIKFRNFSQSHSTSKCDSFCGSIEVADSR